MLHGERCHEQKGLHGTWHLYLKLGPNNYESNELEYDYVSDDDSIVESLDSYPNFDLINKLPQLFEITSINVCRCGPCPHHTDLLQVVLGQGLAGFVCMFCLARSVPL